jgi:hypothetical protein
MIHGERKMQFLLHEDYFNTQIVLLQFQLPFNCVGSDVQFSTLFNCDIEVQVNKAPNSRANAWQICLRPRASMDVL